MYNVCNMYNITETIDCFLYKSYVFQKDCERWSCFVRLVYDFTTKREKNVWKELTEHCYHIIEHCYIYFFQTIKKTNLPLHCTPTKIFILVSRKRKNKSVSSNML